MKTFLKLKGILMVLLLIILTGGIGFADEKGDRIMNVSKNLKQAKDMQGTIIMVLIDKNNKKNIRQLKMYTRETPQGTDSLTEFLSPADVKGTKFLTIGNKKAGDDQRLWLPELGKVRKIASASKDGKFMGSDLTYYDMENHDFDASQYTYLKDGVLTAKKDNQKKEINCWIIKAVPNDKTAPYSKSEIWISKEDHFVYKSDFWDKKNKKNKTISIIETQTIDGIIIPIKTYVASESGHKTLLQVKDVKINKGIEPSMFSIQYLSK